jgi:hypothetical protein
MAEVVVLTDECLEVPEAVSVSCFAKIDFDVEVPPKVSQVTLEGRNFYRSLQPTHDLVHRKEAAIVAQDCV